eukprot:TRINITY_DN2804_c0_g1_i1.p2 TRINITY_DN2804_c0_g1~~TRINITY_DN2804_c0_g1_i1.p2  ORF type:complete len:476 (+),score=165.81 TRINITY_DN2804_c0_g1_i1:1639-3066(+)
MFSGLNLGLMSLDKLGLEVVIYSSRSNAARKHARRIYPIRRRGNLLLCTILLGNVAVNALLSILLASYTTGLMGFLLSTGLIVVFGEIVPQAICSRHGLRVGYYTVWLVWAFLISLLPISYPISKVLDCLLGREIGQIYDRDELKQLVSLQESYSNITRQETTLMTGVLEFGQKEVAEIMTDLDSVYMLDINELLSKDTIAACLDEGYSRIPVFENDRSNIVGLLFVKDLAILNPEDETPVKTILPNFARNCPRVFDDTKLNEMLNEFKVGQSHFAVVQRVNNDGDGDPFYESIGIVTLEDIIEEIIQDEIIDETDVYVDNKSRVVVSNVKGIDYKGMRDSQVSDDLTETALDIISEESLFSDNISHNVLRNLVNQSNIKELNDKAVLFQKETSVGFCAVILEGNVDVIGKKNIKSSFSKGDIIGLAHLEDNAITSFDAVCNGKVIYMPITRRAYKAAVQATELDINNLEDDDFD